MKNFFLLALAPFSATAASPLPELVRNDSSWVLTADHAASDWKNGYPVGNGFMGGLNLGAFPKETIVLNRGDIWSPMAHKPVSPDSRKADMDKAFELAVQGDYAGAQNLYTRAKNKGNGVATFQTLGALEIEHLGASPANGSAKTFRRLDLLTGESTVTTTLGDGVVTETLLASNPDRCVVVRLETTRPEGLNLRLKLDRSAGVSTRTAQGDELAFEGETGKGGVAFATRAKVLAPGAQIKGEANALVIKGGKSATVIITSATNHNRDAPREPLSGDWQKPAATALAKASALGWETLRKRAAADHAELMRRCEIDLGKTDPAVAKLTTPERMALLKKGGNDPDLLETFFQFGRHMLVGSTRPGAMPPNLQGLWEGGMHAAWNGDYHLNINVQMNLWPATVTGLTECNEPYFALLKLLRKYGTDTAASLGCRGYAAGLCSDGWGRTEFTGGSPEWDSYVLGGAWAQEHLMEHYRFTQDKKFLRETAWPILKDGALFMLDWMRKDAATGKLIAGPGGSPENQFRYTDAKGKKHGAYIAVGNTHDHAIAWEVFSDTLEAAKILGIRDAFTASVEDALKRTPPPPVAADGRIMEWHKPFEEVWLGHRHKSHLYGMFPGRQITRAGTPALADAVEKSLDFRMDPKHARSDPSGHTGWNLAWSANLWARLNRGDRVHDTIVEQLRTQVNENLFNRCGGPFQIDGNLGTPAAMAEMLLHSHELDASGAPLLRILPALPAACPTGSARGLRARGGLVVDIDWKDGRVTRATLRRESGEPAMVGVSVNGVIRKVSTPVGGTVDVPVS